MFSGIVEELGKVKAVHSQKKQLAVEANKVLQDVKVGDSIAVNGVCLTVTEFTSNSFQVDVAPETLRRTNLGSLSHNDPVNLERSLRCDDRIGGHFVQGHVDGRAKVTKIYPEKEARIICFQLAPALNKYLVVKGYVAVDGMSLTVVDCWQNGFSISFIPHTLQHTLAQFYQVGTEVNLEVDILGKYVEKFLLGGAKRELDQDFLREHGFLT